MTPTTTLLRLQCVLLFVHGHDSTTTFTSTVRCFYDCTTIIPRSTKTSVRFHYDPHDHSTFTLRFAYACTTFILRFVLFNFDLFHHSFIIETCGIFSNETCLCNNFVNIWFFFKSQQLYGRRQSSVNGIKM